VLAWVVEGATRLLQQRGFRSASSKQALVIGFWAPTRPRMAF
jgi:hypothetical protein